MATRTVVALLAAAAPALTGCGGGGSGSDAGSSARSTGRDQSGQATLQRAITAMKRKGTAALTLRLHTENLPEGETGLVARGSGLIDLRQIRSRYRIRYERAPGVPRATELDVFSDGSATFARPAGNGPYRRLQPSIVANGPADSLSYVATDSVGVQRTGSATVAGRSCTRYEGRLDLARIRRRTPASRRSEFDRRSRGVRTLPFGVCIDASGVLREYRVEVRLPGSDAVLRLVTSFTRVGSAPAIAALPAGDRE